MKNFNGEWNDYGMNGYSDVDTGFDVVNNYDLAEARKPLLEFCSQYKDTNPKDAVGTKKAPMSTVTGPVIMEVGVAMMEGARKYGRHNYRVSRVRASVYYDAAMRHLISWYEGQNEDPDSGLSHITKAIASLAVLRDAEINNMVVDDRPPKATEDFMIELNKKAAKIIEKYPNAPAALIEGDQYE